uniref:Uncharacterized protein n=1 Tax=Pipistrellus kuhlii TaxID=59472 RepID=A0A7J7WZY3_PIPKU|nr:hypothetical protein mPipKuh1_010728 [Pipistrellus kuhlii]
MKFMHGGGLSCSLSCTFLQSGTRWVGFLGLASDLGLSEAFLPLAAGSWPHPCCYHCFPSVCCCTPCAGTGRLFLRATGIGCDRLAGLGLSLRGGCWSAPHTCHSVTGQWSGHPSFGRSILGLCDRLPSRGRPSPPSKGSQLIQLIAEERVAWASLCKVIMGQWLPTPPTPPIASHPPWLPWPCHSMVVHPDGCSAVWLICILHFYDYRFYVVFTCL